VKNIIKELGQEKIDIIPWSEDPKVFISNALSPAKVLDIEINEKESAPIVWVAEDQLSLAIGKGGQNARLAAKLTGWKIDIKVKEKVEVIDLTGIGEKILKKLAEAGLKTREEIAAAGQKKLMAIKGIGPKTVEKILKAVSIRA
jgi:N utilization substance protein A